MHAFFTTQNYDLACVALPHKILIKHFELYDCAHLIYFRADRFVGDENS